MPSGQEETQAWASRYVPRNPGKEAEWTEGHPVSGPRAFVSAQRTDDPQQPKLLFGASAKTQGCSLFISDNCKYLLVIFGLPHSV